MCKVWRNLINQPICWADRAAELEGKLLKVKSLEVVKQITADGVTDDLILEELEDENKFGLGSVANLKRQCKTMFIKLAVSEQYFSARTVEGALKMESAAASIGAEAKKKHWAEALLLEPGCGGIWFDRARHLEGKQFQKINRDHNKPNKEKMTTKMQ